jgi:hypothetical protein
MDRKQQVALNITKWLTDKTPYTSESAMFVDTAKHLSKLPMYCLENIKMFIDWKANK